MQKRYVDTIVHISDEGIVTPQQIRAGYDGEWVSIEHAKNDGIKPSIIAGGIGTRYICDITYQGEPRKIYVFRDNERWFIEVDDD